MSRCIRIGAAAATSIAFLLVSPAFAQRLHVNNLIGEPPDTSNWPHPAAPDANPFPRSTAPQPDLDYRDLKIQLGKTLFWDEQVSIDNTVSCGTCHLPEVGGNDARLGGFNPNGAQGAFGVIPQAFNGSDVEYGFVANPSTFFDRSVTPLSPPTMIGAYVFNQLFWDMRAGPDFKDELLNTIPNFTDWAALEALAVGPPMSDVEMGHEKASWSLGLLPKKLNNSYPLALVDPTTIPPDILWLVSSGATYEKLFDKIFWNDPQFGGAQGVTRERFAMAVAHYHRTLIPDYAPIDRGSMTKLEFKGFVIMDNSGCFRCHSASGNPQLQSPAGILIDPFDNPFSDGNLHDIGFGPRKAPTLRNVGLHVKFFSHGNGNGGLNTLDDVIQFYDNQPPGLELVGSGPGGTLTLGEFQAVKAFLGNALTDPRVAAAQFPFDRPELASERSDYNPFEVNEYGAPTPGLSGLNPEIIANAPPLVHHAGIPTNWWFKFGVGNTVPLAKGIPMVSMTDDVGPVFWVGPVIAFGPSVLINPQGIGTSFGAITPVPALLGTKVFAQWMIDEGNGSLAFSDAAVFKPFQF